jgi:hypothetical protein
VQFSTLVQNNDVNTRPLPSRIIRSFRLGVLIVVYVNQYETAFLPFSGSEDCAIRYLDIQMALPCLAKDMPNFSKDCLNLDRVGSAMDSLAVNARVGSIVVKELLACRGRAALLAHRLQCRLHTDELEMNSAAKASICGNMVHPPTYLRRKPHIDCVSLVAMYHWRNIQLGAVALVCHETRRYMLYNRYLLPQTHTKGQVTRMRS